jgi:hypothetical protein
MKHALALALLLALAGAPAAMAKSAPKCATGIACGNTCIPKGQVCHAGAAASPAAATAAASAPATASPAGHPNCKPGVSKPCGASCISLSKTCHH